MGRGCPILVVPLGVRAWQSMESAAVSMESAACKSGVRECLNMALNMAPISHAEMPLIGEPNMAMSAAEWHECICIGWCACAALAAVHTILSGCICRGLPK